MSECCSTSVKKNSFPKKHTCPSNGKKYGLVSSKTIKHHVIAPWNWVSKDQAYYFCSDPDCSVVYFGEDDSIIEKSSVRSLIIHASDSSNPLICYCYGVTKTETENNPLIRQFVREETKQKRCACDTRNPSGKCCLNQFPKPLK